MNFIYKKINTKIITISALLLSSITLSAQANDTVTETKDVAAVEQGCGEIILYSRPPKTKDIHYAWINQIDGQTVSTKSTKFTLSSGTHRIKIIEKINSPHFTRRRGEMMNAKYIDFVIKPNEKYALGAKFVRKKRSKLKTGEYWEPVVWKTTEAECSVI